MRASPRAVLFDLDGTLIDTAADFVAVLNQLLTRHQREVLPFARIRETVSDGARALVQLGFGIDESAAEFEFLRLELLALYQTQLAVHTRLFEGMDAVLAHLDQRDIPWAIVTNKPQAYTDPLLRALDLHQRCRIAVCPDHVSQRKPDPEGLLLACRHLGCPPESAIYLGDHRRDIEAGRNARMPTVACRYGYIHADDDIESWRADFIVDTPADIMTLLPC
ncbi:MAG TPA: HAD-IA family hydrolase [Spongiibacteraceae bacterium]|nr:HAD-IA family hydrolase [Spongiibacteraceae bacterium]